MPLLYVEPLTYIRKKPPAFGGFLSPSDASLQFLDYRADFQLLQMYAIRVANRLTMTKCKQAIHGIAENFCALTFRTEPLQAPLIKWAKQRLQYMTGTCTAVHA